MQKINILWTGGFDSTYRILELSRHKVEICPIYVLDKRHSESFELEAMARITEMVRASSDTEGVLRDLNCYHSRDIVKYKDITDAYTTLHYDYRVGAQYDWLARLARQLDIKLELGIEKSSDSHIMASLFGSGDILRRSRYGDSELEYMELDPARRNAGNEHVFRLYENFIFPLPLFEMTKLDTLEAYKRFDRMDIAATTWFCHKPVNGLPCGVCSPCRQVMRAGMGFRIPSRARLKYYIRYNPLFTMFDSAANVVKRTYRGILANQTKTVCVVMSGCEALMDVA